MTSCRWRRGSTPWERAGTTAARVARWLMAETHRRVVAADEGYERAILGVDSENPTGALALYRSQGYEDVRSVTALNRPSLT